MTIAYRAGASASRSNTLTPSVTIPATVQVGDLMLAYVAGATIDVNAGTVASGWTQIGSYVTVGSSSATAGLWYKIAASGDAGTNFVFTVTGQTVSTSVGKVDLDVVAYSGVDGTNPINASAIAGETAASTTHASPFITTTAACWIVTGCTDRGSPCSTSLTPAVGNTARQSIYGTLTGSTGMNIADSAATTASGLQNAGSWTGTISTSWATMWTVALLPAATATSATTTTYDEFVASLTTASINFLSDTIKVALVSGYSFSQTHQFFSSASGYEVASGNGYTTGGVTLASKTDTTDTSGHTTKLSSGVASWTASGSGLSATGAVVYKSTGTNSTSPLICYVDFGATVSVASGNTLQITPDATYGWVYFAQSP